MATIRRYVCDLIAIHPAKCYNQAIMNTTKLTPALRRKVVAAAIIIIYALLTALIACYVGKPMIKFASDPVSFRHWVDGKGILGRMCYMGMAFLQVLAAIIPGEPLEIAGGYAFGAVEGTILCLLAEALGGIAVFMLVRRFGTRLVEVFFRPEKLGSLKFLKQSPKRDILLFLIFMIPGTPKDLICYFAGLTDVKIGLWLLICSLGRLPSVVTSAIGGGQLGTGHYMGAVIAFAATAAVSIAGLFIYELICKKHSDK